MNNHLKDRHNAIGTALATVGGVMLFTILANNVPTWIPVSGLVLRAIGIGILVIRNR